MQLLAADGCILTSFAFVTIDFVLSLSLQLWFWPQQDRMQSCSCTCFHFALGSPHVPDGCCGLRAQLALEAIGKIAIADEKHRRQGTNCKDEKPESKVHAR